MLILDGSRCAVRSKSCCGKKNWLGLELGLVVRGLAHCFYIYLGYNAGLGIPSVLQAASARSLTRGSHGRHLYLAAERH